MKQGFEEYSGQGWWNHGNGNRTQIFDSQTKKLSSNVINWQDGFNFISFDEDDETNKGRLEQCNGNFGELLKNTSYNYDKGFYEKDDVIYLNFGNGKVAKFNIIK